MSANLAGSCLTFEGEALVSMSKRKSRAKARDVALFRYSLVRPLLDMRLTPQQRGELVRSLAAGQHVGPAGEVVWVSRSTLDRWARTLRLDGFEALAPRPRQVTARTAAELLELAVALKRERPGRTATQVGRIMRQTHGVGPSARTLQRHFARLGLGRHVEPGSTEVFGRFEALCGRPHNASYDDFSVMPTRRVSVQLTACPSPVKSA